MGGHDSVIVLGPGLTSRALCSFCVLSTSRLACAIRANIMETLMRLPILICCLVIAPGLTVGCSRSGGPSSGDSSASPAYAIVYEATGQGTAEPVTYFDPTVNKESKEDGAALPWKKEVKAKSGDYITMSVIPKSSAYKVACRITASGREVASVP